MLTADSTTNPAPEETAPTAPILPVPEDGIPLEMHAFEKNGQVFLAFNRHVDALQMTPKVTRQVIRQLSQAALAADRNRPGKK